MRYFIEFAYNGKAYHGWQKQPNVISVQEVLEKALTTLLNESIEVVGAGRTDTGVHAIQMYAHLDLEFPISDPQFVYKMNQFLPKDIVIKAFHHVKDDAHARFDATSRTYNYIISEGKNPFTIESSLLLKNKLDIDKMNQAAAELLNYKNFKCFSKVHTNVKTYNCNVMHAEWKRTDNELIFTITADRFLRNMVRAIVGTMLDIGNNKIEVEDLKGIIESQDRSNAGTSVLAQGLYLSKITYPEDTFLNGNR
ncbi:MAG: tRNA pseudouridine(38-40) synthase TruA [Bacteroidia bacterium]|nr:tRNA pseudouridine(38-40) synthase TruA [Bacteroidia bacterium]MBT8311189.1 tRNA pseudouridine(38-40) synthase TruA [Bacteroidia bacterium]NNL61864.1 tRNA pseudouridine(38-40) synthase TruA [Flavobacteriaceae bacterium]